MAANPILEAFPSSTPYAAAYVCDGINRAYDDEVDFWPKMFGRENIPEKPAKPTPYPFSFFELKDDTASPVVLLGPCKVIVWITRCSGCRGRRLSFVVMRFVLGVRMCGKCIPPLHWLDASYSC